MAYCRWWNGDVYMFNHVDGYICCCACSFNELDKNGWPVDEEFSSLKEALRHLYKHREAGHRVPDYAFERIRDEIGRLDLAIHNLLDEE